MLDKKLTKSLEKRFNEELARSPNSPVYHSLSPVGPMTDVSSRRTLFNLICTLNAAYPDYDFSDLTLDSLVRERNLENIVRRVDSHLEQAYQYMGSSLRTALWNAIEEVISPAECELYSHVSSSEEDPFGNDTQVWSIHLFFYNKRQKKVLLMVLSASNRFAMEDTDEELADLEMDVDDSIEPRVTMLAY